MLKLFFKNTLVLLIVTKHHDQSNAEKNVFNWVYDFRGSGFLMAKQRESGMYN